MTSDLVRRIYYHLGASAGVRLMPRNGVSALSDETHALLEEAAQRIDELETNAVRTNSALSEREP